MNSQKPHLKMIQLKTSTKFELVFSDTFFFIILLLHVLIPEGFFLVSDD